MIFASNEPEKDVGLGANNENSRKLLSSKSNFDQRQNWTHATSTGNCQIKVKVESKKSSEKWDFEVATFYSNFRAKIHCESKVDPHVHKEADYQANSSRNNSFTLTTVAKTHIKFKFKIISMSFAPKAALQEWQDVFKI